MTFCNEFTPYDYYNIRRVIKINHLLGCILIVLSDCDQNDEKLRIRIFDVIDDISLMFSDRNVEKYVQEVNNLVVGFLQLLCLENL